MSAESPRRDCAARIWCAFATWIGLLVGAWAMVWLAHERLASGAFPALSNRNVDTGFWLVAKSAVWIVPTYWLARRRARSGRVLQWLGVEHAAPAGFTFVTCSAWLAVQALIGVASSSVPEPAPIDAAFANAVIVAPLFEEFLFRGFALQWLTDAGVAPAPGVAATTAAWALLHVPGWIAGGLTPRGMLSRWVGIAVLGVVLGALRLRTKSLRCPIAVHVVHNVWHQGLALRICALITR